MASQSCLNPSMERTVLGEGDFTFIVESAKRIHSQQGKMQEGGGNSNVDENFLHYAFSRLAEELSISFDVERMDAVDINAV